MQFETCVECVSLWVCGFQMKKKSDREIKKKENIQREISSELFVVS